MANRPRLEQPPRQLAQPLESSWEHTSTTLDTLLTMDVSMSGVDIDAEFDMDQNTAIHDLGKRLREEDEMSRTSSPSRTDSVHGSAKKPRRKVV